MRQILALLFGLLLLGGLFATAQPSQADSPAQFAGCATEDEMPYAARFVLTDIYDLRFTVTVLGVGFFDPQIMIMDENDQLVACTNDDEEVSGASVRLPTAQATGYIKSARQTVRFFEEENIGAGMRDYEIIISSADGQSGEFVAIVTGEYLDDGTDVDSVLLDHKPSQVNGGVSTYVYAVNMNQADYNLNPVITFARGMAFEQRCTITNLSSECGANTVDLEGFSLTLDPEAEPITFRSEDVMLAIPPTVPAGQYFMELSAWQRSSYGPYALVIHSGVAYPPDFEG